MLNKRLRAIAELIEPCNILFDVGSDHGFLPLNLLQNNKINQAIIGEINQGPLEQAIRNFDKYPELNVEFLLSDGLQNYSADLDAVVIAGMGFETIQHILVQDLEKFKKINQIIIQSNTKIELLRRFLNRNNFHIIDESIIKDRKYYYPILKIKYLDQVQSLSESELLFGPILIKKYTSTFFNYLKFLKSVEEKVLLAQKKESSEKILMINELLKLYKYFD